MAGIMSPGVEAISEAVKPVKTKVVEEQAIHK